MVVQLRYVSLQLKRMKEGKYTPGVRDEEKVDEDEEDDVSDLCLHSYIPCYVNVVEFKESDSDEDGGYLHPSLFANAQRNKQEEEEKKEKFKVSVKLYSIFFVRFSRGTVNLVQFGLV